MEDAPHHTKREEFMSAFFAHIHGLDLPGTVVSIDEAYNVSDPVTDDESNSTSATPNKKRKHTEI